MGEKKNESTGSLLEWARGSGVDYTKKDKPGLEKKEMKRPDHESLFERVDKLEKAKQSPRKSPGAREKTSSAKGKGTETPADQGKAEINIFQKDDAPQPFGDDRSVFARASRDVLNRLPQTGSIKDMLKSNRTPSQKKDKGRDR